MLPAQLLGYQAAEQEDTGFNLGQKTNQGPKNNS